MAILNELSDNKKETTASMGLLADKREKYIKKNLYYYNDLINFLNYNIAENSHVLEIGCGTGYLLNRIKSKRGVGIDISSEMIKIAKEKYPDLNFYQADAENIPLEEKFDYIVISDTLGYFYDIQKVFKKLHKVADANTRVLITYHNFLWLPLLKIAEFLELKMPQKRLNWLNKNDIENLLTLEGFEIIKSGQRFLFPKKIYLLSDFVNKYIAPLPIINKLCLTGYLIARPLVYNLDFNLLKASVIIPARNEEGNIENAVIRMPEMGKGTEIIFVEGNSSDNTLDEIKRVSAKFAGSRDIKYFTQSGKGKGDAVRKGFNEASGDILMILDADLTMPPEDLPKFFEAIASGRGEFINGTRLVYPMEKDAMRTLNMMANKFFSIMFSWLLGQRLKDTLCGTKVLSKNNYMKLIANRRYFGEFDPFGDFDLIFGASKLNLKIVEVPIRYKAREYGSTNISRFKHGWLLLKMVIFAMNKIKFI